MVLLLSRLSLLLSHLTSPTAAPHTALLLSLPSGGAILASHSSPIEHPFPPSPLEAECDDDEERKRCYAAVAVGSWDDQRKEGAGRKDEREPVMLETELGRIALVPLGSFLLVLVGNQVAPWKVLDKKIRAAAERLKEPLEKVVA